MKRLALDTKQDIELRRLQAILADKKVLLRAKMTQYDNMSPDEQESDKGVKLHLSILNAQGTVNRAEAQVDKYKIKYSTYIHEELPPYTESKALAQLSCVLVLIGIILALILL